MEIHVFDMDGVLVDTRAVVEQAYTRAASELGLTLPADYWGRTAAEWGCTPELHLLKQEIYCSLIGKIQPAWAFSIWAQLHNSKRIFDCRIWTGASVETVMALHTKFRMLAPVICGMSRLEKRQAIIGLCSVKPCAAVHYYDDNAEAARFILAETPNVILHLPPQQKGQ